MAKVIGCDLTKTKKFTYIFTCTNCGAIVQYKKSEEKCVNIKDNIFEVCCPNCGEFTRTNN